MEYKKELAEEIILANNLSKSVAKNWKKRGIPDRYLEGYVSDKEYFEDNIILKKIKNILGTKYIKISSFTDLTYVGKANDVLKKNIRLTKNDVEKIILKINEMRLLAEDLSDEQANWHLQAVKEKILSFTKYIILKNFLENIFDKKDVKSITSKINRKSTLKDESILLLKQEIANFAIIVKI